MRPSLKQVALLKKEEQNRAQNAQRKNFWKEIHGIASAAKAILALKKREKPDSIADNDALDDEVAPLYIQLCEKAFPVITPYIRAIANQKLQHMTEMDTFERAKPLDKKEIN